MCSAVRLCLSGKARRCALEIPQSSLILCNFFVEPLPGTDHGDRHARDPETVTGWMGPFYELKDQLQRDEAMRVSSWAFMR